MVPYPRSMAGTYRLISLIFVTGLYLLGKLAKLIGEVVSEPVVAHPYQKNKIKLAYIQYLYTFIGL